MTNSQATLTKKEVPGGWTSHSITSVQYYSKAKNQWGFELVDTSGYKFFLAFVRKCDAVEATPFVRKWDGEGDPEISLMEMGFNPEGFKGCCE